MQPLAAVVRRAMAMKRTSSKEAVPMDLEIDRHQRVWEGVVAFKYGVCPTGSCRQPQPHVQNASIVLVRTFRYPLYVTHDESLYAGWL